MDSIPHETCIVSIRHSALAAVALLGFFVSGCIPLPPPDLPPIVELPKISGQSCVVNVIRTSQFVGYLDPSYVTFEDGLVAKIIGGEYTSFNVAEGTHKIGVIEQFWGILGCGGYTCGGSGGKQALSSSIVECHSGKTIFLGVTKKLFDPNGFNMSEVTDSDEEFLLKDKTLVPAGIKK